MASVFLKLLNMSITAGWLVLAVIFFRLILKRAPKWISCLLWGIVGLRLVMPFSLESVLSLVPTAEPVPPSIIAPVTPPVKHAVPTVDTAVTPIPTPVPTPNVPVPEAAADPLPILLSAASVIWIAGLVCMLIYGAVSYLRVSRTVRASIRHEDNVYLCDSIDSPFLLGVIRPRIFIPSGLVPEQMEHVVSHERAHLSRGDHLWKPIGFLLLSVYWFNPIIWAAYILLCRDIEKACDEKVIGKMDTDGIRSYMETLVSCSVRRRMIMVCPLAFGEVGIKERMKNVISYKKPAVWVTAAALVAGAVLAVCFLTDPKAESDSPLEVHAAENEVLDLRDSAFLGEVVAGISDGDGLVTVDELNAVIELCDTVYGKYTSIKVTEDKIYPVNTAVEELTFEYVDSLTYENYHSDYESFEDYRVGHYKLVMALLNAAFPENYFTGDALAGDAAMILDPANSGYDTVGYAVGGMVYGEDVGPVVYFGGGNLYLCDTATGDYEMIYPTAHVTRLTELFYDVVFGPTPDPTSFDHGVTVSNTAVFLRNEAVKYLEPDGVPDYLDVEFVKTLTIENYEASKEAYCNYEENLSERLIGALEVCPGVAVYRNVDSIYKDPLWTMDYILLDSEKVPYDDEQILTWYLDYRFSGGTYGKEGDLLWYNTYGYEDNENLDFGDMIVIVDKGFTEIYYYDTGTGESERLYLTTNNADDELIECYSDLRREKGNKEAEEWLLDYYKDDPVELEKLKDELEIWNQHQ